MSLLLALVGGGGGAVAYTLTGTAGTYALAGQAGSFKVGRLLAGSAGAYSLAGQAAAFKVAHTLPGAAGAYTLTGRAASLLVARTLSGAAGAYALAGNAGTLTYTPGAGAVAYTLTGAAGSYALTGQDATFTVTGQSTGAGGNNRKRRKLYAVEIDGVDRWFDDPAQALAALEAARASKPVAEAPKATTRKQRKEAAQVLKAAPEVVEIPLAAVGAWADVVGQMDRYKAAYNSLHYGELLALFELMRDDDDIEALLMAV